MKDQETAESRAYKKFLVEREEFKAAHKTKAQQIWAQLNDNARHGIRVGLFPVEIFKIKGMEGYDQHTLTCALMDVAAANGGMKA